MSTTPFADYKYREGERDRENDFLAHRTVLNEAEKNKKGASAKRWGVFDAGRIIGPNKL